MTAGKESFRDALTSLWLRLSTVAIVGLLFLVEMKSPEWLVGWSFYLSASEEVFETIVFAAFTALAGVALGTLFAAVVAPFLFFRKSSRYRIVEIVTRIAVAVAAFIDLASALNLLLQWVHVEGRAKVAVFACYFIAFGLTLRIPRRREQLVTSLENYLGEKTTRRAVFGTGIAAVALIAAEAAMGKTASAPATARRDSPPSGPNVLLVTFDALSAEDMSLYGYRLPTTPHIDEFARGSSVFTNFYSASTFTTSSVASLLTGLQPSEHHVYHLPGRFSGSQAGKTLPRVMRAGGYVTGASISNPLAYFLNQGLAGDYDFLPEPPYRTRDFMRLWNATTALHRPQPFGSRAEELTVLENVFDGAPAALENLSPRLFGRTRADVPPASSFHQARGILERMPDGFFLWVHLLAPHFPYLPEATNVGRFLHTDEMRTPAEQDFPRFWPHYAPNQQGVIDKARLRYDEFLADADSAFGDFISGLERAGKLRNTAVIVSADHGESFEGGLYTHNSNYQTRPEIHVPLIVRLPGQQRGSRVSFTADQTALAPTILEIAGIPRADWMRGESLVPWLNRNNEGEGQGLAFTQYLSTNSIFKPVTHGTVGVIDGRHQYVLDLGSGKGILRGLAEAQSWNLDRSTENPALARTLRDAIQARFPDLPLKPA
jgi:arylsulfatase A-like enzyme